MSSWFKPKHWFRILQRLDALEQAVTDLKQEKHAMSEELDTLIARVSEIETVADSAIELLGGLKQELDDALASSDPPAALAALSERLELQTQELADAITANTPAADEPPLV